MESVPWTVDIGQITFKNGIFKFDNGKFTLDKRKLTFTT